MAIAFRNAQNVVNNSSSTIVLNKPTGTLQNDVLLAWFYVDLTTTVSAAPSGWVLVDNIQETTNSYHTYVYRLVCGASEPASYTWTLTSSVYNEGIIIGFSGVDTTTPVDAHGIADRGSTASLVTPSITASVAGDALIAMLVCWNGNAGAAAQNSYTLPTNGQTSAGDLWLEYKLGAASGANGADAFTCTTAGGAVAALVALKPAGGSTTTTQTLTSTARITATTTKTLSSTARITAKATRTLTSVARITATTPRTLTSVARITATATRTLTSVARITAKTQQTLTSVARIAVAGVTTRTLTSTARITATSARTLTSTARLQRTATLTLTSVARVQIVTTRTLTSTARLRVTVTRTLTSVARVQVTTARTLTSVARIAAFVGTVIGTATATDATRQGTAAPTDKPVNTIALVSAPVNAVALSDKTVNTVSLADKAIGTTTPIDV